VQTSFAGMIQIRFYGSKRDAPSQPFGSPVQKLSLSTDLRPTGSLWTCKKGVVKSRQW